VKTALITGITGQDGHHLTKLLLEKGYKVCGLVNGQRNLRLQSFKDRYPNVHLLQGDLIDFASLLNVLQVVQPDELYNLAAMSFVGASFDQPELTANVTGLGTLRILEAVRKIGAEKDCKIYQASSSDMFGKAAQMPQNENTPFKPKSPYGVAKTFAHYTCTNYRENYGMHISCGILFNHEGENRGHEFVTRKITSNVAKIALKKQERFSLGSISAKRDWGYAGDFVQAMWLMLQQDTADDYVIATGVTHSVREFVEVSLQYAGLRGEISSYLDHDPEMDRPSDVDHLVGDPSKALRVLGWKPESTFEDLVRLMVEHDIKLESKN
jgi:GDPmannose 4,6-dehydratase